MIFSLLSFLIAVLFSQTTVYVLIIFSLLYYFATRNNDFFERRGVKYRKPVPFFGNLWSTVSQQKNFYEHYQGIYNEFKDVGMFGSFEFTRPILMIRDPDLAKQICIKDFENFVNHRVSIDQRTDPIFGGNLFVIKDNKWKLMRNMMSPAFTGNKMRFLFSSIRDSLQNTTEYLLKEARKTDGVYEFEARDLFTRCSVDVIASAAFGIEVNSIRDKNNEFYEKGFKMADFTKISRTLRFFIYLTWPKLGDFLKIKILEDEYTSFFKTCLLDVMQGRQQSKSSRPDFVQILLQAKTKGKIEVEKGEENEYMVQGNEGQKYNWSDDDLVAQSVIFFLAGFETATTLFNYMAYELAINEDIQERLLQEIDDVLEKLDGKPIDYESIHQMKYLDMVIQESLRKHPPNIGVDRVANKQYTLEDKCGQRITLEPGDAVFFPTVGFHHDTRFWENPSKFDPERFSDENKHKIDNGVYMPFGIGPRQCIGNRFALMEAKILFFSFLKEFKLVPYEKTPIPLEYKKGTFGTYAKNGIWLHFKTRK